MTERGNRTPVRLDDMVEATRLTALGRLDESTALIQRSLLGLGARPDPAGSSGRAIGHAATIEPHERAAADSLAAAQAALSPERMRAAFGTVVRGLGRGVAPVVAPVLKGLEGWAGGAQRAPEPGPLAESRSPGGDFIAGQFSCAAGTRDYKLFVPSRPQAQAPLLVMLHGCTQSPDDFAAGTGMNPLAERAGIYVVYPGQSRLANGQKCWNWFEPRDQGREGGEAAIIAGLTRALIAEHGLDSGRVYIAGMSAGGAAAANIARAYPDLYAAVGIHSGLAAGCARDVSSALMAMQVGAPGSGDPSGFGAPVSGLRVPTIVFHGDEDGTVSVRNADQVLAQAGTGGLAVTRERFEDAGHPFTRTRYTDGAGRVLVEDWRVRGAGHAWSGGDPRGSYTDARGPNASRAMLDFFAQHSLTPRRAS
jgi:poly(hydroxyalkanoate) depolymerase family esterase